MPEPKNPSSRYLELDVFRGLAALSVLCFHLNADFGQTYGVRFDTTLFHFQIGASGVQLFFMISGFVILMTLEKTSHILDFIVSRFSRLYPAYWTSIVLLFIVKNKFPLLPVPVPLKTGLIDLSMLQYWFRVDDLSSVYWTLSVELSFYFLMALVFLGRGLRYIEALGFLWLAIMMLNKFFIPLWPPLAYLKFAFLGLLSYGHLFLLGILFYGLKTRGNRWYRHAGIMLCLLVQYLVAGTDGWYTTPCVIVFTGIFYLFIMDKLGFIVQKPLLYFGTISYSLYLIHQDIGWTILQWLYLFNVNALFRFIIPTACCILIAALMTFFIEKPAMKFIRKYRVNP